PQSQRERHGDGGDEDCGECEGCHGNWAAPASRSRTIERPILRFDTPHDPNRLIWIDLEMSGLRPDSDRILEVALVVTDHALETVAQAPVWVVHEHDAVLDGMDAWNRSTHARSGLVDKVRASHATERDVEMAAL